VSNFEPLFTWVHLSDIHMGHGDAEYGWNQQIVLSALREDIQDAGSRGVPPISALLVTGDLAFSGSVRSSDEYQRVASWLRTIAESHSVNADSIFVIPGNHDVQRNIEEDDDNVARLLRSLRSDENRIDNALSDGTERALLTKRMQNYLDFARNFGPANADTASEESNLFWTQRIEASEKITITLAGFNTALLCAKEEDEYGDWGKLQLGQEQIARGFSQTPSVRDQEVVVALSHHPFDWLRDKVRVSSAVRQYAHIHLCGHIHEAGSDRL
jgi:predicted MPP superfamily phosphohydrolase